MSESCHFAPLDPRTAKLGNLRGLLTGDALTFAWFRDFRLTRWVRKPTPNGQSRRRWSSPRHGTVRRKRREVPPVIVDFIDLDSDKWRPYRVLDYKSGTAGGLPKDAHLKEAAGRLSSCRSTSSRLREAPRRRPHDGRGLLPGRLRVAAS